MNAKDQERHHAVRSAVRGQASPGAIDAHWGTALEGRSFYVWDEDRQSAVTWANELATAASLRPRRSRRGMKRRAPK